MSTSKSTSTAKKFATKDGARNKAMLNRVVKMRHAGNSWRTIGEALDVSPRTALRMYDEVLGKGAHHGLLPGKGGRTSPIAKADIGGSGGRYGVDPAEMAALAEERKAARAERRAARKAEKAAAAEAAAKAPAKRSKAKAKG